MRLFWYDFEHSVFYCSKGTSSKKQNPAVSEFSEAKKGADLWPLPRCAWLEQPIKRLLQTQWGSKKFSKERKNFLPSGLATLEFFIIHVLKYSENGLSHLTKKKKKIAFWVIFQHSAETLTVVSIKFDTSCSRIQSPTSL